MKKTKKLHKEDKQVAINFIDYARLQKSKPTKVSLEIKARHLAEHLGINPDITNARLANAFAKKFEANQIA